MGHVTDYLFTVYYRPMSAAKIRQAEPYPGIGIPIMAYPRKLLACKETAMCLIWFFTFAQVSL